MSKEFGQRLSYVLKRQGISQKEFAKKVGATEATVSYYINGVREPRADMLLKMAEVLGVTADYLVGAEIGNTDFAQVKCLLEQSKTLSPEQKLELIRALLGTIGK